MAGLLNGKKKIVSDEDEDEDDEAGAAGSPDSSETDQSDQESDPAEPAEGGPAGADEENPDQGLHGYGDDEDDSGTAPPAGQPAAPAESADDQAAYEQFVKNGMRIIYDEKAMEPLLKSLEGDGDPVEGMANTVGSVISRLLSSAQQKGTSPSPAVVLHGAGELIQALAELSAESGGHSYTDEEMQKVVEVLLAAASKGVEEAQPAGQAAEAAPDTVPDTEEEAGQPMAAPPGAPPPRRGLLG